METFLPLESFLKDRFDFAADLGFINEVGLYQQALKEIRADLNSQLIQLENIETSFNSIIENSNLPEIQKGKISKKLRV